MTFIRPDWPAPRHIHAYTSLRQGGVSKKPYDTFNLAHHVGDAAEDVNANRQHLMQQLQLKNDPLWINQTHSTIVLPATAHHRGQEADASYTHEPHQACVVLTADCLPILMCDQQGTVVAAIHAGWRGLAAGIVENTVQALQTPVDQLLVWLGPAISQANFEVGEDVKHAFVSKNPEAILAFKPNNAHKWQADLYALARLQFKKLGITRLYGGQFCTFADKERLYSYRRDGKNTGRMATLIYFS